MSIVIKIRDCFITAKKDEEKGKKHKGLVICSQNNQKAKEYLNKAKDSLRLCKVIKEQGFDYKLPEEWFYSMYYCGLAMLCKFGVESRSQRCTALFLRYVKNLGLIQFDEEFIDRIMVYSEKEKRSDVDDRQDARYGSWVKDEEIIEKYNTMMEKGRKCIDQCEEMVLSNNEFQLPKELLEEIK